MTGILPWPPPEGWYTFVNVHHGEFTYARPIGRGMVSVHGFRGARLVGKGAVDSFYASWFYREYVHIDYNVLFAVTLPDWAT